VLPTAPVGQAALAWRYWDQRSVERRDGTRRRPLDSRVLVGSASVLTPDLAIALCQAGPRRDIVGPLPTEVPDDAVLPTVGGDALDAVTRAMTPVLDQEAAKQAGLLALVAAGLTDPHLPLAISVPDQLIQAALPGVQCPLLWGLRRITGPLLGPAGRGWSFSTFEPPLGDTDPASLPSIVFRRAPLAPPAPPARWRKEFKVSPLAANALEAGSPYADYIELAGWLVAEYQARGGDRLEELIVTSCGSEKSLPRRLEQIHRTLSEMQSPVILTGEPTNFISLHSNQASAQEEPESSGLDRERPLSERDGGQPPTTWQEVQAGRDANFAGRDQYIINQYSDRSSEAAALGVRSASEGAKLLAALSRADETLDRARHVLTGVSPSVAAPALKVLLRRDDDLVIALLVTINEAKAENLVSAMGPEGEGLEKLLEASEAITECESRTHKVLGERAGRFLRANSRRGTQGFLQMYANGAIHWSPGYGAHATTGAIAKYHSDNGGSDGLLGFPVAAAVQGKHPRTGTECSWQLFEGPSDYSPEVRSYLDAPQCGATVISSPKLGTHATRGAIGGLFELDWRDSGWLGLPVDDAIPIGPSRRMNEAGTSGWRQRFESGTVYSSEKAGAIRVPRGLASHLESRGGIAGATGFPVSPVLDAATSPYGTKGWFQRFEGAWDYPKDVLDCWSDQERPGGATIYLSEQHGAHTVQSGNGVLYERLNGTASWLGFPTSDETDEGTRVDDPRTIQRFEGGAIFYARKYDSVAVRREVIDYLAEQPYSPDRLGFPTQESEPLATGNGNYIQLFERGVVMVRGGRPQAWVDPANLR
jgi:hypothetical protein